MDLTLLDVFKEKVVILNFLVTTSFFLGVISFIVSFIWKTKDKALMKVGGVIFVAFLALFANQVGVYALSIIIIATLITELDFLENLAAIFWGRKEFWDYKIASANKNEIENKIETEVQEAQKEEKDNPEDAKQVSKAMSLREQYFLFEEDVLGALKKLPTFISLRSRVKLTLGTKKFILDAIGTTFECDFIIEIKMSPTLGAVHSAVTQIRNYLEAYNQYTSRIMVSGRKAKGIIVLPSHAKTDDFIGEIAILKFNPQTKDFTNLAEIKEWIVKEGY